MPTYAYRCVNADCGHEEDRFLPFSKFRRKTKCPKCGHQTLQNVIASAVVESGTVVPGLRVEYPSYNPQLPVLPGQKPGEQIVHSRQHLRELCARHDLRMDQ